MDGEPLSLVKQSERRGLVSEWDSKVWVLESLLDLIFTTIFAIFS